MTSRATGVGSMPGQDFAECLHVILGEVGELPFLPELPARGVHAGMIGRTLATIDELGIDLQPAGWRLTDASGVDHRRAVSLLAQDLDTAEELRPERLAAYKIQLVGPWTLAATVERPRGDKVLGDFGARRDLAQALAEGVRRHVDDVRRRLAPDALVVQVDEPALPAVVGGAVPTASGFHRHRSVSASDAALAIEWVVEAAKETGAEAVLHCCAADIPWSILNETALDAVSFDLDVLGSDDLEAIGGWVDADRAVWPGVVPTTEPQRMPSGADLTRRLLRWWSDLGYTDTEHIPDTIVTPACGLASSSPAWARTALELSAQVARNLSVEQGKMDS